MTDQSDFHGFPSQEGTNKAMAARDPLHHEQLPETQDPTPKSGDAHVSSTDEDVDAGGNVAQHQFWGDSVKGKGHFRGKTIKRQLKVSEVAKKSKRNPKLKKSKRTTNYAPSSSSSSSSSSSDTESSSSDEMTTPKNRSKETPEKEEKNKKKSIDEGRPHPLFYAIGKKLSSDPTGNEDESNPAGSVQRAITYVNGRSRKLRKTNFPTVRVAQHNSLVWLFLTRAKKSLQSGFFGLDSESRLKKLFGNNHTTGITVHKAMKKLDKEASKVSSIISSLDEVIKAANHEITMARVCEEDGFSMVQDFEGDELFDKEDRKRVEKLKKKNKHPTPESKLFPSSSNKMDNRKGFPRPSFYTQRHGPSLPATYGPIEKYGYTRGRGRGRNSPVKSGTCHNCGKLGHWQRECGKPATQ